MGPDGALGTKPDGLKVLPVNCDGRDGCGGRPKGLHMSLYGLSVFALVYTLAVAAPGPGVAAIVARVLLS